MEHTCTRRYVDGPSSGISIAWDARVDVEEREVRFGAEDLLERVVVDWRAERVAVRPGIFNFRSQDRCRAEFYELTKTHAT